MKNYTDCDQSGKSGEITYKTLIHCKIMNTSSIIKSNWDIASYSQLVNIAI